MIKFTFWLLWQWVLWRHRLVIFYYPYPNFSGYGYHTAVITKFSQGFLMMQSLMTTEDEILAKSCRKKETFLGTKSQFLWRKQ